MKLAWFVSLCFIIMLAVPSFAQSNSLKAKAYGKINKSKTNSSRSQKIDFDSKSLIIDKKLKGKKQKLQLSVFDDLDLDIEFELSDIKSLKRASWKGSLVGDSDAEVFISKYKNAVVVDVIVGEKHYQISPDSSGGYKVEELDITELPVGDKSDAVDADLTSSSTSESGSAVQADVGVVTVDILVAFTSDAAAGIGGDDAIIAFSDNSVNSFNTFAQNSNNQVRLRLVHAYASSSSSAGAMQTDLSRFNSTNDGFFDEAHTKRNDFGADLISLITKSSDYCGYAYTNGFLSVVGKGCAISNKSFAHEVGHNLGANHDVDNASTASGYAHGHRFYGASGKQYRTVMAYAPGTRVGVFSNPDISYDSTATGVAGVSNNVRTMEERAPTTANYRQTVVPSENPVLKISNTSLNYGSVNVGNSKTLNIDVSNTGLMPLEVSEVVSSSVDFQIISNNCSAALELFESCIIQVQFSPSLESNYNESVQVISSNAENGSVTVSVSGQGAVPKPQISIVNSLNFGRVNVGNSNQQSLNIQNSGDLNLDISAVNLNDSSGMFTIVGNSCSLVKPGASCRVDISFAPSVSGDFLGSLSVQSNDLNKPTAQVSLSGSAVVKKGGKPSGGGSGGKGGRGKKK